MSNTTHTTTFSAVDNVSTALQNIGNAAKSTGERVAVAQKAIADASKQLADATKNADVSGKIAELGNEVAQTTGKLQKLASGMEVVAVAAGNASKKAETFKGRWEGIASVAANTAVAISHGVEIVKKLGATLAKPFELAFKFDNVATNLARVTGSIESARKMAESLRQEAANGTMDFEQLASVAQRLGSVFSSTENIQTWTTAFHNLAAGTGADINELVNNFVKLRAAGRKELAAAATKFLAANVRRHVKKLAKS